MRGAWLPKKCALRTYDMYTYVCKAEKGTAVDYVLTYDTACGMTRKWYTYVAYGYNMIPA